MEPIVEELSTRHTAESLVQTLTGESGVMLLQHAPECTLVVARPFLHMRSYGLRCELNNEHCVSESNPWQTLERLMACFASEVGNDLSYPAGGCFGYWGYDLKNFVEPTLPRTARNDLGLPDCNVGFYDSVVVFEHSSGKVLVISTGLQPDGSRSRDKAQQQLAFWRHQANLPTSVAASRQSAADFLPEGEEDKASFPPALISNLTKQEFIQKVESAQRYIRSGDIYQVNLSRRLSSPLNCTPWMLFQHLSRISPAPYAAWLDCGEFQICSSSPELFLRMDGRQVTTRPIKGTRPRSADPARDRELARELQTSTKENAELVMITDLLRNDLGKVCEFGSVRVPELVRWEKYAQVQHLVATVQGRLRADQSHLRALASSFPGGSITGAPKIRAMQIIDELEPITRGPYTGAIGYLGFNQRSQLSICIRTAICEGGAAHFNVGAGIVADSVPEAEFEETAAKAAGFIRALGLCNAIPNTSTPPLSISPP